ncbi:FG-GAP repeat protein [Leptospira sp. 201903074]|uniref:FG-GAP repeat protein n=1 Tax=Leptospira abararensis TaxID=2810036 RepID=UPI00196670FA|nr:FG-GAP repeat protein [Leptospira abararensis]MBM9547432.1 FG-GAP repeat protein [Leptospira abararensis]
MLFESSSENPIPFCGFCVRNAPKLSKIQAYLKASNVEAGDLFGNSVVISRDTIVVGSTGEVSNQTSITTGPSANNSAVNSGAGCVFIRK